MARFPVLVIYQLLFYLLSAIVLILGLSLIISEFRQPQLLVARFDGTQVVYEQQVDKIAVIIESFYTGGIIFIFILAAQMIRLFMKMEDHLINIRFARASGDKRLAPVSDEYNPDPKQAAGMAFSQGYHLYEQRNYEAALKHFSDAITIDPTFAPAYNYRGLAYRHLGEDELAQRDMEKAKRFQKRN